MSRFRNMAMSPPLQGAGVRLVTVYSPALKRRADMTIWVPEQHRAERLPLLILLHGVYGSHWNWWVLGGVADTVRQMIAAGETRPLALAMPSDGLWRDGTAYVPHRGFDAERWIVEDVPEAIGELLPEVETQRFYLAGLSMGGYGAVRLGMKYADRVRGISAHSAVTRLEDLKAFVREPISQYMYSGAQNVEIAHWMQQNRSVLPPLRFDCGRQDSLLASNRALHALLRENGIAHVYEEHEGGHTWEYWQAHVRRTLRFVSELEGTRAAISGSA